MMKAVFSVLWAGKELTHAEAWKNAQAILALLTAIASLMAAMGHPLLIDNITMQNIATGLAGVASAYLTYATSSRMGIDKNGHENMPDDTMDDLASRVRNAEGNNIATSQSAMPSQPIPKRGDLPELP